MFNSGKRHKRGRAGAGARVRLLTSLLAPWVLAAGGCGFWDDFRQEDYSIKRYFHPEDPILVLKESTDGNKRAHAYGRLTEPLQNKGTQADQDFVVQTLTKAATTESGAYARCEAIRALSTFKDPRACTAVKSAYYEAEKFAPEDCSRVRIQSLNALGRMGNPEALDLLVRVVQAPPVESSTNTEDGKQLYIDERLAAASALEHFKNPEAIKALVAVLHTERDIAMRDRVTTSLRVVTGKKLPPDAKAWDEALGQPPQGRDPALAQNGKVQILPPIQRTSATDKDKPQP